MIKNIPIGVLALLALAACRSKEPAHTESTAAEASGPVCICGTPEAAMDRCLHPECLDGKTNPDNPDCVCGTIPVGPR